MSIIRASACTCDGGKFSLVNGVKVIHLRLQKSSTGNNSLILVMKNILPSVDAEENNVPIHYK